MSDPVFDKIWKPLDVDKILTPGYCFNHFNALDPTDYHGLIKVGGRLNTDWIIEAYSKGIFPWYEKHPAKWYSPLRRLILRPIDFKVTRSFKKTIRRHDYEIKFDSNFPKVIRSCATSSRKYFGGETISTWITPSIIRTYESLHFLGVAHSVEVWRNEHLVGGLYGLSLGRLFFGESMFYTERDCSKLALYCLCEFLKEKDFLAIDCQVYSEHLESLGGKLIFKNEFLDLLLFSHQSRSLIGNWSVI